MLNKLIYQKAKLWLTSPECKIKSIVEYIRNAGYLREPQIEAIEVYLFLKIAGENKPLRQLLSEGFFSSNLDFGKLNISVDARNIFEQLSAARSIFEFVRSQVEKPTSELSSNEKLIANNAVNIDFDEAAKNIFYDVEYADYLFSLPMGAGKTFLMAAIMYLDLYFAQTEPENKLFAHNFLVLIPSGLKTSIIPSLRSIEKFDPSWVIPEPAASNLKRHIKFEVLDEAKSAKKSNKAKNPNVQKIARHQPFDTLSGLIMVVNAEKVILDRVELDSQGHLFEKTDDEKDVLANELRNFIGKIPNMQIHIDEVHHATDADIKLRQVVNKWHDKGNVNGVLGFSGTPYLESREKIKLGENVTFESEQITNTVYYYPLIDGIKTFLKKPEIKSEHRGLDSLQIIRKGVEEFREKYGDKVYADGTTAKLAIYCGTIERLETEVFPFLTGDLGIDHNQILKFHKGNKDHPLPPESELEFKLLDEPVSKKQIILLVQIGKEGWDCRSLTGVILSQAKDCPKNMVLQTSCRCLRQVEKNGEEKALIWLSKDNAAILDKQLAERQKTSIGEINNLGKEKEIETVERFSRIDYLKLPKIDFYQLKVEYDTLVIDGAANPKEQLAVLDTENHRTQAIIAAKNLTDGDELTLTVLENEQGVRADYNRWLFSISKNSFGFLKPATLRKYEPEMKDIFEKISFEQDDERYFDDFCDRLEIEKQIRLAFHSHRELKVNSEIIPDDAQMLIVENLRAIPKPRNFLPNEKETKEILEIDAEGLSVGEKSAKLKAGYEAAVQILKEQKMDAFLPNVPEDFSAVVKNKDRTFHFLPYKFDSGFEKKFLETALSLDGLANGKLEIYFNGEKDVTDFRIACYTDKKKYVGRYTPDFLVIERKNGKIFRVLIVETKGSGYAEQKAFILRRKFIETEFLKINNEAFNYNKFDYLYLTDADTFDDNLVKFNARLKEFFGN